MLGAPKKRKANPLWVSLPFENNLTVSSLKSIEPLDPLVFSEMNRH
jgi:hypothetical protein